MNRVSCFQPNLLAYFSIHLIKQPKESPPPTLLYAYMTKKGSIPAAAQLVIAKLWLNPTAARFSPAFRIRNTSQKLKTILVQVKANSE